MIRLKPHLKRKITIDFADLYVEPAPDPTEWVEVPCTICGRAWSDWQNLGDPPAAYTICGHCRPRTGVALYSLGILCADVNFIQDATAMVRALKAEATNARRP